MPDSSLHPQHLHTLVLLHLSVAYGADDDFDPAERYVVVDLVQRWLPYLTVDTVESVVDTAFKAARSGMVGTPEALAAALGDALTPDLQRRVLADLGHVARADGSLSVSEADVISRIRRAWA
ncbi:MAG: TerB family tellurite resistance protein [Bacteroidota bacterium]